MPISFRHQGGKPVVLPDLKKGVNRLEIRLPFAKRINLEACFILGDRWSYEYQLKEIGLMISPQIRFF